MLHPRPVNPLEQPDGVLVGMLVGMVVDVLDDIENKTTEEVCNTEVYKITGVEL